MTLSWKHFPAGERGFFRAPVLITGKTEAILVDGGFTLEDGRALARAIATSGKKLTTVYVSQSDPDYYFSLRPIRDAFPDARVIAAPVTVASIQASVQKKLDVWGPKLGENGPRGLADVVLPTASSEPVLSVDGETIAIVEAKDLANRRYLWVPSLKAVVGGVLVFSGVHVWTADTPTPGQREAWGKNLEAISALQPEIVVAGHAAMGAATDRSAIEYTRDYLLAFEEELAKTADSRALHAAMTRRYPNAGMVVALDIGAKVATGETKWG
jgi:glyoxylase-like metal-dependent hydrolase (beta-lactamase superfamily II)